MSSPMKSLDSLCQNDSFFRARIALITFYEAEWPVWSQKVLVLLEYLQLMSQGLLLYAIMAIVQAQENQFIFRVITYFLKLINLSSLLPFGQSDHVTSSILIIVFCLTILKFLLFLYIGCITYWNFKASSFLVSVWRFVFRTQGRVLCYLMTSFWVQTILSYSQDKYSLFGVSKPVAISLCSILIGIEYIFSFFLKTQFCYVLPSKSFLASKSYRTEIINLSQKLLLQVSQLALLSTYYMNRAWVFSCFNLALSALRAYEYYQVIPLYNLRALVFEGDLISLVFSLSIASFTQTFLAQTGYFTIQVSSIIMLWILAALLSVKLYRGLIEKKIVQVFIAEETSYSPKTLIHKVTATKQLRKFLKFPSKQNKKMHISYLLNAVKDTNLQSIFSLADDSTFKKKQLIVDQDNDEIFIKYVEKLSARYPNDYFVKLYLAYLTSKDPNQCIKSIRIIAELKQKKWSKNYLSVLLLLYEVQRTMMTSYNDEKITLDLPKYIKSQIFIEKFKKEIIGEIDLKIMICNNIVGESSNIGKIHSCAQQISKTRLQIEKRITTMSKQITDCLLEPYLLAAGYQIILSYSKKHFEKYNDMFHHRLIRYKKSFDEGILNNENLYQDTNAFLILSGEKFTNGQIIFCSNAIQNICGNQKVSYNGAHVSTLFTPSFQLFYSNLFKQIFEAGHRDLLNKSQRAYLCHKEGHIVEVEIYLRIHPYLTQNLYLNMIIRPVPSALEYVLVKENGDIEGATKNITKSFGINITSRSLQKSFNVKLLSEELFKANEAFNVVMKNQLKEDAGGLAFQYDPNESRIQHHDRSEQSRIVSNNEALELYNLYTSQGKILELKGKQLKQPTNTKSLNEEGKHQFWRCQISVVSCGSTFMKLLKMEKRTKDDEQNEDGEKFSEYESPHKIKAKKHKVEKAFLSEENLISSKASEPSEQESENFDVSKEEEIDIQIRTYLKNDNIVTTEANYLLTIPQQSPLSSPVSADQPLKSLMSEQRTGPMNGLKEQISDSFRAKKRAHQQELISSSQGTADKRVYNAFQANIATKSYPKSFKPLCLAFYGAVLLALVGQVILKIVSDNTLQDLVLKKNLLTASQLRSYRALLLVINYRGVTCNIVDPLNLVNKGPLFQSIKYAINNANLYKADLKNFNKWIVNNVTSLDEGINSQLMATDVRMFGTYVNSSDPSYVNVNSFDALEMIIGGMQRITYLANPNSTLGLNLADYMIMNILGDFLYKSFEMTTIFTDSVDHQRQYFQNVIALFLIVTPILLAGIVLMLIGIIWNQYAIEKGQILTFIKLDPAKIKDMLSSFHTFKKGLLGEEKQTLDDYNRIAVLQDTIQKNYQKSQFDQNIIYTDIRTKYSGYIVKVIFYVALLIGVMIWNYISAQNSTAVIYRRQSQLEYAGHISETLSITYSAIIECFLSNNTYYVKREIPLDAALEGMAELTSIQAQLTGKFQELDGSYDPQVKALLFDHKKCTDYPLTGSSIGFCNFLASSGYLVNLITLIDNFDQFATAMLNDFYGCDQSNDISLLACAFKEFTRMVPTFTLAASEAQIIGTIVGNNLENSVREANDQRNLLLTIFSISLVIVGLLTWIQILMRLKEVHNEFKKVLQVFPPNLILSSFLLKTFLQRNSKDFFRYYQ